MELYKKQLLNILNCSISNRKFYEYEKDEMKWEKIIEEADRHKISALIYNSINKETLKAIDPNILNKWKISILQSNIIQINMLNYAREILLGLQENGIKVIVLKGIILKSLYQRYEFRTMYDLDILVHTRNYEFVKEYLKKIGYVCEKKGSPIHSKFYNENKLVVEVHWKLINKDYYIGDEEEFEENIWKNTKELNIYGMKITTLSDENFLIHMLMHMAVHIKCNGFGLRQLYDLALFSKVKCELIEWENFKYRVNQYGIIVFVEGLYAVCDKIFKIQIPYFNLRDTTLKEEHINLLLNNIIDSGLDEEINSDFKLRYNNKAIKVINIVFKSRKELAPTYNYVKKYCFLLPIAWVHRIFRVIRKYGLINIFRYMQQEIVIRERKLKIINIFDL